MIKIINVDYVKMFAQTIFITTSITGLLHGVKPNL